MGLIRALRYVFLAIIVIVVLRMVIGWLMRGASSVLGGSDKPARPKPSPGGGELKRDPVCGTYVSPEASVKATVGSEVLHFCSANCRDKYRT